MTRRSSDAVSVKHLDTLYRVGAVGNLTDGQLLSWFLAGSNVAAEAAFAAVVERHGPMVLRVCRQVLADPNDAQDAFQATFLVLVRQAGRIRNRDALASWLYGIAQRVARRSRADASRRRAHEQRCAPSVTTSEPDSGEPPESWPELHEEVARLPERFREAIVLCYLEGLTTEAVAQRLGCARGTVLSRLARARERLRKRLTRRGLAVPAGLAAAGLSAGSQAATVPAGLSGSLRQAALRVAAGKGMTEVVPIAVATLVEGVLTMIARTRLAKVAGASLAVGVIAVGMGIFVTPSVGDSPTAKPDDAEQAVAPRPRSDAAPPVAAAPSGEIVLRVADIAPSRSGERFMGMVAMDPATAKWRTIASGRSPDLGPGPVSPDGRFIVFSRLGRNLGADEVGVWIYDTTGETTPRRIFERDGVPHWSHDGQRVVIGTTDHAPDREYETWCVDFDGTHRIRLPIPGGDLVLDCSRDGAWLATRTMGGEPAHRGRLTLVHPDGTDPRYLTAGSDKDDLFTIFKISPDAKQVAYVEVKTENKERTCKLFVIDIEGKNRRTLPVGFEPGVTASVDWSPDGKGLVLNLINNRTKQSEIGLVDVDGKDFRKLPLPPGSWNIQVCGWQKLTPGLRARNLDEISEDDARTPRGRYRMLLQEVKQAKPFVPHRYAGRFLAIAESAPEDRVAVDALHWIVTFTDVGPQFDRAVDQLAERHAANTLLGQEAGSLAYKVSPATERLLRAVIAKNPVRPSRARASLALGRFLKNQSERVRHFNEVPEDAPAWEAMFLENGSSREDFLHYRERDPAALMKEAEAVLERTIEEFGDVPGEPHHTVGQSARSELFEIRSLCAGRPAPEIEGRDTDGLPLKLNDYRGKVILVNFWADWCGGCRAMLPYERSLVERMRGRPFVLLGVNGDDDREQVRKQMKEQGITWRSWWDRRGEENTRGSIAEQFNVRVWPTLYLIDHHGMIRHKFLGTPGNERLDAAIDTLVKDAESTASDLPRG